MIHFKMIVQLVSGARSGVAFSVKHGLVINKEYCNTDFNVITDNEALVIDIDLRHPKPDFGYHLLPKWKSEALAFRNH